MAKFKEVNACPPVEKTQNVNISTGATNLWEKKRLWNNARKELRERRGEMFSVNLVEFIFYCISGGGKLSC